MVRRGHLDCACPASSQGRPPRAGSFALQFDSTTAVAPSQQLLPFLFGAAAKWPDLALPG